MTAFLFFIYIAIGAASGWALQVYGGQTLPLAVGGGAVISLILGQVHLFLRSPKKAISQIETKVTDALKTAKDVDERIKVVEARTDAVETSVKHELSERSDALISEMRQLEGLIERLSLNFESRLVEDKTKPAAPADDEILHAVKLALKAGRVDLHLQPIMSLPQRRVAYYEGFSRLRRADGSLIMPAEFLDAARRSNLMGLIDNMMLFRCVQIVRKLAERDRRVGVFCNISAALLEDDQFFPSFLSHMEDNRDLAGALIFELRADRFETRSRKMRESMNQLVSLGFRFSVDHAAGLLIDLPRLQDAGVRFVKMNGNTLLEELRDPEGARPICSIQRPLEGEEVSAVFTRYGVTLIAEKLEDEVSVVEILAYDIPFGQGNIFGAPRPIKSSLMEETAPPHGFIEQFSRAV